MVPITVSYFSKSSEKSNIGGAVAYCLGIMGTFTGLGLVLAAIIGAAGVRNLANSPILNGGLALLFIVLAVSLFGVFEIRPPSWLVNKASGETRRGGFVGPVMMGLTFTLTSFTCTVPVVGALLAAASSGSYLYPIFGMLAFSTAFAAPFFLLALFPQALARLPKSGSWMVSVKAFLGFVELLAAVKFISNVDLVYQLAILTQPVFLALWAAIAGVAGIYMFGWLRLPHDPATVQIGIIRRAFGVLSIAGAVWFLSGINGRSLGEFNGFLPPEPYPGKMAANAAIPWLHDYDKALQIAKAEKKLVFVNFTGVNCTNCRAMEKDILPLPEVAAEINKCVPVELWTDRLNEGDKRNQKIQFDLTKDVTLPLYAIVTSEGKLVKVFRGSTRDPKEFIAFLQSGISKNLAANQ